MGFRDIVSLKTDNLRQVGIILLSFSGGKTEVKKIKHLVSVTRGFPGGSMVKNLPANAGDEGSIPGSGRSPGEGNGNPLQYSCLGNLMDRGAWWATVRGVAESDMTQ